MKNTIHKIHKKSGENLLTYYNKWFEKLYFLEYNDDTRQEEFV